MTQEFKSADTDPAGFYILEEELNNHLGKSNGTKLSDYDINGDKKLNIYEFARLAIGVKRGYLYPIKSDYGCKNRG